MSGIRFFSRGTDFKLQHPRKTSAWISAAAHKERVSIDSVDYIFGTDAYLLRLNRQYLKHDTYTDIITFDYSEVPGRLDGELYLSVGRIRKNAVRFKCPFDEELHRVIIHGLLHLVGYKDKSAQEKALMREREQAYLSLR